MDRTLDPFFEEIRNDFLVQIQEREASLDSMKQEKRRELQIVNKAREDAGVELFEAQAKLSDIVENLDDLDEQRQNEEEQNSRTTEKLRKLENSLHGTLMGISEVEKRINNQERELRLNQVDFQHLDNLNNEKTSEILAKKLEQEKATSDLSQIEAEKIKQEYILSRIGATILITENRIEDLVERRKAKEQELDVLAEEYVLKSQKSESALNRAKFLRFETNQLEEKIQEQFNNFTEMLDVMITMEENMQSILTEERALKREIQNNRNSLEEIGKRSKDMQEILKKEKRKEVFLTGDIENLSSEILRANQELKKNDEHFSQVSSLVASKTKQNEKNRRILDQKLVDLSELNGKLRIITDSSKAISHSIKSAVLSINAVEADLQGIKKDTEIQKNKIIRQEEDLLQKESVVENLSATKEAKKSDLKEEDVNCSEAQKRAEAATGALNRKLKIIEALGSEVKNIKDSMEEDTDEPLKTLENKLKMELKTKTKQNESLQNWWKSKRNMENDLQEKRQRANKEKEELNSSITIFERKLQRFENIMKDLTEKMLSYKHQERELQAKNQRLNLEVQKYQKSGQVLSGSATDMEGQVIERLQHAEEELASLRTAIVATVEGKNNTLQSLMRASQETKVLQKKISLLKRIKNSIDLDYGMNEVSDLRSEIKNLRKREKAIIASNEAIMKMVKQKVTKLTRIDSRNHDILRMRLSCGKKPSSTKMGQDIDYLTRRVAQSNKKKERLVQEIEKKKIEIEELTKHIATLASERNAVQGSINTQNKEIACNLSRKTQLQEVIMRKHELIRISLKGQRSLKREANKLYGVILKLHVSLMRIEGLSEGISLDNEIQKITKALEIVKTFE